MSRISHLLNATLTHLRKVRTTTGRGAFAETFETVATVRGRVSVASWKQREIARQQNAEVSHCLYFEPNSDIRVHDVFVFEDRRMLVVVPNLTPSVNIYQSALAREIQR